MNVIDMFLEIALPMMRVDRRVEIRGQLKVIGSALRNRKLKPEFDGSADRLAHQEHVNASRSASPFRDGALDGLAGILC